MDIKLPCVKCGTAPRREVGGSYCVACQTINMREWRARNPDRNRENGKRSDKKRYSSNVAKYTAKRRERMKKWKLANPDEYKRQCREKYYRIRERAMARLGRCCACCGEDHKTMLQVDHVYNDGYKESDRHSYSLMKRILKMEAPLAEFQILCGSCNHSKARNHGLCEHYTKRWEHWIDSGDIDPGPYPFAHSDAPPHDARRVVSSWMRMGRS